MTFILHPKLEKDCVHIGDLPVCSVMLMNDSRFPWLVLVPKREDVREVFDLDLNTYQLVMEELRFVAERFASVTGAFKTNIAMLGNQVPQLHIHVIARFENDDVWPQPVWSATFAHTPYTMDALVALAESVAQSLES